MEADSVAEVFKISRISCKRDLFTLGSARVVAAMERFVAGFIEVATLDHARPLGVTIFEAAT